MKQLAGVVLVIGLGLSLAAMLSGCSGTPTGTQGTAGTGGTAGDDATTLTSTEEKAVATAKNSCQSLGQAVNTAQSATGNTQGESSFEFPVGTAVIDFGVCPNVKLNASSDGQLQFDMTIDFGDGCNPGGSSAYTCSGSASGTFDQKNKSLTADFSNVSCNGATLTGNVALTYDVDVDEQKATLAGQWKLTYTDQGLTSSTDGTGTGNYDAKALVTTVETFTGSVSDDTWTWSAKLTNIQTSFAQYLNLIPFAGEMTLSSPEIRNLTVKFDEQSPTTGNVQVSINGGPYFQANLFTLYASL